MLFNHAASCEVVFGLNKCNGCVGMFLQNIGEDMKYTIWIKVHLYIIPTEAAQPWKQMLMPEGVCNFPVIELEEYWQIFTPTLQILFTMQSITICGLPVSGVCCSS